MSLTVEMSGEPQAGHDKNLHKVTLISRSAVTRVSIESPTLPSMQCFHRTPVPWQARDLNCALHEQTLDARLRIVPEEEIAVSLSYQETSTAQTPALRHVKGDVLSLECSPCVD